MKRYKTREVKIGKVTIGKDNPIRIQSMTNTKTEDIEVTTKQILALENAGCEIVRLTVQGKKQAYALEKIKNNLIKKGSTIPLVADIHFYPMAASIAADFVDKIRINPGNFAEKRAIFAKKELSFFEDKNELLKIEEKLYLLIEKLKKNKVALRIGVNHGSLSDRIMTKYGNTIKAMVISAVEYTKICRKYDFHNIVFSMKSSSSFITIEAYRALVNEMLKLNWDYPLHLGVTEAGDFEDGIIKSSIGIGALLADGIGDTIRVSLTEDPTKEIMPAKDLIGLTKKHQRSLILNNFKKENFLPAKSKKKIQLAIKTYKNFKLDEKALMADIFYLENDDPDLIAELKKQNKILISKIDLKDCLKIYSLKNIPINSAQKYVLEVFDKKDLKKVKNISCDYIIFKPKEANLNEIYDFLNTYQENHLKIPIILHLKYENSLSDLKILASFQIGLLCFEKQISAILLDSKYDNLDLSLNILQACRLKRYKTEFIACPGCGRTLFNLQKTLKEIKDKTSHLKDIKIAIMGCIVNGPGEMQDADFGYVGSKNNQVDLYVNKKCIEKNINQKDAVDKLISLIKKHNKWIEKN